MTVSSPPGSDRQDALVLLFWASWATPSRPSLSTARELARRHQESIEVLVVDIAEPLVALPPGYRVVVGDPAPARRAPDPGSEESGAVPPDRPVSGTDDPTSARPRLLRDEVPSEDLLGALQVSVVPTWVRLERARAHRADDDRTAAWQETSRLEGARAKHEVERTIFTASSTATSTDGRAPLNAGPWHGTTDHDMTGTGDSPSSGNPSSDSTSPDSLGAQT